MSKLGVGKIDELKENPLEIHFRIKITRKEEKEESSVACSVSSFNLREIESWFFHGVLKIIRAVCIASISMML